MVDRNVKRTALVWKRKLQSEVRATGRGQELQRSSVSPVEETEIFLGALREPMRRFVFMVDVRQLVLVRLRHTELLVGRELDKRLPPSGESSKRCGETRVFVVVTNLTPVGQEPRRLQLQDVGVVGCRVEHPTERRNTDNGHNVVRRPLRTAFEDLGARVAILSS